MADRVHVLTYLASSGASSELDRLRAAYADWARDLVNGIAEEQELYGYTMQPEHMRLDIFHTIATASPLAFGMYEQLGNVEAHLGDGTDAADDEDADVRNSTYAVYLQLVYRAMRHLDRHPVPLLNGVDVIQQAHIIARHLILQQLTAAVTAAS